MAWGVLAVSLALMALVAALTQATGRPAASADAAARIDATHRGASQPAGGTGNHAPGRGDAVPTLGASPTETATASPTATSNGVNAEASQATLSQHAPDQASGQLPSGGTTPADDLGDTADAAPGPGGQITPATTPTTVAAPVRYPGQGNIASPTVSATYPAAPGPQVTATATWTGLPTLTLSIVCPDGQQLSRTGGPGLSVSVDDGTGDTAGCSVTLAVPPALQSASLAWSVSYTLDVEPAPEG